MCCGIHGAQKTRRRDFASSCRRCINSCCNAALPLSSSLSLSRDRQAASQRGKQARREGSSLWFYFTTTVVDSSP